jgi:hypothetical protein
MGRDVAVKMSAEIFSDRFEREAHAEGAPSLDLFD